MKAFYISEKTGNLISPKGRLSYPYLFAPNPKAKPTKDGKPKYTCSLLLPPDVDFGAAKKVAQEAAKEFFGAKLENEVFRKALRMPFLDAYEKTQGDDRFKDWTLLRLSSVNKPEVVDGTGADVHEPREAYAGRWACLSLRAFGYDVDGNRGVSFGLVNVQLLDNDEPLAGGFAKATDDFKPVADGAPATGGKGAGSVFDD